jgi:glutaredoxin 3
MGTTVTVYTMESCPFCLRAKELLKRRGVAFSEVLVPMDDEAQWEALEKRSGMKTMPQIFTGDRLIGGFSDLSDLDGKDQLTSLKS